MFQIPAALRAESSFKQGNFIEKHIRWENFSARTQYSISDICFLQHRRARIRVSVKGQISRTSHQCLSPIPGIFFFHLFGKTLKNILRLYQWRKSILHLLYLKPSISMFLCELWYQSRMQFSAEEPIPQIPTDRNNYISILTLNWGNFKLHTKFILVLG